MYGISIISSPTLIVAIAFAGCLAPALLARFGRGMAALGAAGVMAVCLALLGPLMPAVLAGETLVNGHAWLPDYGLDLSFRLDGLGLLFCLLILVIGLLVVLYAYYYLPKSDRLGRFYSFLLLFMAAMLGVVLSENLLLVVFWEITSISSFLLITYRRDQHESRIGGSYELSVVLAKGERIRGHSLYAPMLILVLLGAFTKSAQFPFHFWRRRRRCPSTCWPRRHCIGIL